MEVNFCKDPVKVITHKSKAISSFINETENNLDKNTVDSFGEEWSKFSSFTDQEIKVAGDQYFDIVDESIVNKGSYVLDVGCGTGRWSYYLSKRAKFIEAIDPSVAVYSAVELTKKVSNIRISQASVESIPFKDETFDFVFSLGVLHHVPNTQEAIIQCVKKVKMGGYFLVYLYYDLDNRGKIFRGLFNISNVLRVGISRLPQFLKLFICDVLSLVIYLPFVVLARMVKKLFPKRDHYKKIPLSYYVDKSFHIIRNDSLDRFGTPLEQRFTKEKIQSMLERASLKNIVFSESEPYWHAVGQKI